MSPSSDAMPKSVREMNSPSIAPDAGEWQRQRNDQRVLPAAEEEPQHGHHTEGREPERNGELAEDVGGLRRLSTEGEGHSRRQQLRRDPLDLVRGGADGIATHQVRVEVGGRPAALPLQCLRGRCCRECR